MLPSNIKFTSGIRTNYVHNIAVGFSAYICVYSMIHAQHYAVFKFFSSIVSSSPTTQNVGLNILRTTINILPYHTYVKHVLTFISIFAM